MKKNMVALNDMKQSPFAATRFDVRLEGPLNVSKTFAVIRNLHEYSATCTH